MDEERPMERFGSTLPATREMFGRSERKERQGERVSETGRSGVLELKRDSPARTVRRGSARFHFTADLTWAVRSFFFFLSFLDGSFLVAWLFFFVDFLLLFCNIF